MSLARRLLALVVLVLCTQWIKAELVVLRARETGGYTVVRNVTSLDTFYYDPFAMAYANYNDTIAQIGWDQLLISPNRRFFAAGATPASHQEAYRAAGYLEGYITAQKMWYNYVNTVQQFVGEGFEDVQQFIEQHVSFMTQTAPMQSASEPRGFRAQLQKILAQVDGLYEGYNAFVRDAGSNAPPALSYYQIFLISYQPEISDVQVYLSTQGGRPSSNARARSPKSHLASHCSALIKPVIDPVTNLTTDLFISQVDWDSFNSILKQYKTYDFETTVVMSSYPGALVSQDDWYMTSNGIVAQETTNSIYNTSLYADYFSPNTVSEWIRSMIATYLATTGEEWVNYFTYLNSGTYNNQWMVVDTKLFSAGLTLDQLPDGLLWITETAPGFAPTADVTSVLRQQGYWASYNIFYFRDMFVLTGNLQMEQEYGSWFSYHHYARPLIFARNHSMVTDLESMKALMRYNNFEHDPLSDIPNCTGTIFNNTCKPKRSATLAVACRGDLDPVGNASLMGPLASPSVGAIGQVNNGALDAKIAVWSTIQTGQLTGVAIAGPTSDQQPVFNFSNLPEPLKSEATPRLGIPDVWDFAWNVFPMPTERLGTEVVSSQSARLRLCNGTFTIEAFNLSTQDPEVVATVAFTATMNYSGWDHVEITASPSQLRANSTLAYYGAGYLEGYTTAVSIYYNYYNMELNLTQPVIAWIEEQLAFMRNVSMGASRAAEVAGAPGGVDRYSKKVRDILAQIQGLTDGYNKFASDHQGVAVAAALNQPLPLMTTLQMYLLSFQTELWDVETYISVTSSTQAPHGANGVRRLDPSAYSKAALKGRHPGTMGFHCSALVKPLATDVFVAHDTWAGFNSMLRQLKTYRFETTVSMSSYPGFLVSSDDYYVTSNGLTVVETTNNVFNTSLYADYFSSRTVAAWVRAMTATYLADSAEEWQRLFTFLNSGTYNNQWMAVDMKLFTPGTEPNQLPNGFLWISETVPGFAPIADVTSVIRSQGYWASYNIPYFPFIFEISGNLQMEQEYGSYFSYHHYARPLIFARNQSMVTDLESMKALMRYNNFEHDPLSDIPNCTGTIYNNTCNPKRSATLAIASRGDLDPIANASTMGPLAGPTVLAIGLMNNGALDSKIAAWSNLQNGTLSTVAISGPTSDQQKPFDFRTIQPQLAAEASPRVGLPELWTFDWQVYRATVLSPQAQPLTTSAQKSQAIISAIIGIIGAVLAVCIAAVVLWHRRHRDSESGEGKGLIQGDPTP